MFFQTIPRITELRGLEEYLAHAAEVKAVQKRNLLKTVSSGLTIPKDPFVCPKNPGLGPLQSCSGEGIGTQKILFDREGSGSLGYNFCRCFQDLRSIFWGLVEIFVKPYSAPNFSVRQGV